MTHRQLPCLYDKSGTHQSGKREGIALLDNVGGEWERQGFGMGLRKG